MTEMAFITAVLGVLTAIRLMIAATAGNRGKEESLRSVPSVVINHFFQTRKESCSGKSMDSAE